MNCSFNWHFGRKIGSPIFAGHFEGIYDNAKQLSFPGTNALHRQKDALIQRCTVGDVFDHMQWFSTNTRPWYLAQDRLNKQVQICIDFNGACKPWTKV